MAGLSNLCTEFLSKTGYLDLIFVLGVDGSMKMRKHPPLNRPPPLATDPPYDQRPAPYSMSRGPLAKPLVEFTAADLELNPSEEHLFFGRAPIEIVGGTDLSLWDFLHRPVRLKLLRHVVESAGVLEKRGWSLVEALRVGKRKNAGQLVGGSLLVWCENIKVWDWMQGEMRFEKVQQGLSLWGVLRHTHIEEWRRSIG